MSGHHHPGEDLGAAASLVSAFPIAAAVMFASKSIVPPLGMLCRVLTNTWQDFQPPGPRLVSRGFGALQPELSPH